MTAQVVSEAAGIALPARSVTSVKCTLDTAQRGHTEDKLGWWLVEGGNTGHSAFIHAMEGRISDGPSPNLLQIDTSNEWVVLPPNSKR